MDRWIDRGHRLHSGGIYQEEGSTKQDVVVLFSIFQSV